jgi:hypothetical protein
MQPLHGVYNRANENVVTANDNAMHNGSADVMGILMQHGTFKFDHSNLNINRITYHELLSTAEA